MYTSKSFTKQPLKDTKGSWKVKKDPTTFFSARILDLFFFFEMLVFPARRLAKKMAVSHLAILQQTLLGGSSHLVSG